MTVKTLSAALWGSEILMVFIKLRLPSPHGDGFLWQKWELLFQFLCALRRWSSLCLSLGYLNLSLSPAGSIPPPPSFVCLAVHPTGWDAMRTMSFLPVGGDVAGVLSLSVQALITEKAFFLLKQKANCPVPAGANMKLVLFAGWEGSASRFVGENAGMHIQPADWWAGHLSAAL